ncbi:uncharacterized protein LOC127248849 [Andrographis paniculata]|uniref:uncharacterized protein LOC127248849 n=1 Tax=Andrographis paniculata TaxID=175694 RepID=UPI0021E895C3|nr:uncharacterized protein LOC127248849 [Andrographis paniculata]
MDMKCKFLERFFPTSRAANLRKEIYGIKQASGESLYEYWDRFNKLIARCLQHQISEQLLIQYFYEGLTSIGRRIIDATSGGDLMKKTAVEAWELLNDMAMNSQQFGPRDVMGLKEVAEDLHNEGLMVPIQRHTIQDGETTPIFDNGIRISNPLDNSNHRVFNHIHSINHKGPCPKLMFLQETRLSIKNLEDQMSQVVKEVRDMKEREKGKLLAQTHMNPSNVSSMVLRSGKELEGPKVVAQKEKAEEEIENEIKQEANKSTDQVNSKPPIQSNSNVASFSHRLVKPAKSDKDKEIMEMFKKVELTIPLLDAIKQVLCYAKFLKELCIKK